MLVWWMGCLKVTLTVCTFHKLTNKKKQKNSSIEGGPGKGNGSLFTISMRCKNIRNPICKTLADLLMNFKQLLYFVQYGTSQLR